MTDNLSLSLDAVESALRHLDRRTLLRSLQHGVLAGVVRGALGAVGLRSTADLETVYGWHDGTSTSGIATVDDIHVLPGFYLLSVEDAIANYRAFVTDSRWAVGWFPIFANGGGDFYVADLSAPDASPIRHFRIDEGEHPVEFESLGAMFSTIAQAFERDVFFVDSSGYLEMDDLAFGELAAELNPHVEWWRG